MSDVIKLDQMAQRFIKVNFACPPTIIREIINIVFLYRVITENEFILNGNFGSEKLQSSHLGY